MQVGILGRLLRFKVYDTLQSLLYKHTHISLHIQRVISTLHDLNTALYFLIKDLSCKTRDDIHCFIEIPKQNKNATPPLTSMSIE